MASDSLICAHENIFNQSILEKDAYYFTNCEQISDLINTRIKSKKNIFVINNKKKINELYSWSKIVDDYNSFFHKIFSK